MKTFFLELFTWWNGQTMGTRWFTRRHGVKVGEDSAGNVYYRTPDGKRRWVIYNGVAEPSAIEPGWHGWIHHRVDTPPTQETYVPKAWEKPHRPNRTGTPEAYRPQGSILTGEARPRVSGDYDAWTPG